MVEASEGRVQVAICLGRVGGEDVGRLVLFGRRAGWRERLLPRAKW
jgi:hypothetical protein